MKVSVEIIKKMSPCQDRFEGNFLLHYPNYDSSLENFLSLDKISYNDKIWVCKKLLNRNQLTHFGILSAQSVLSIYENKFPNDTRISDLLSFLITITDFSSLDDKSLLKLKELRTTAAAAADAAYAAADAAAADAAYAAAAYAAAAAAAAAYAAADAYAAAAAAAYAAAYVAADARSDNQKQTADICREILGDLIIQKVNIMLHETERI